MLPAPSIADVGRSDVRMNTTVCPDAMFGMISVSAEKCWPQSFDVHQLTPPLLCTGMTSRPHTDPGAEPGGGGCTSGTPPMSPVWPTCGAAVVATCAPTT